MSQNIFISGSLTTYRTSCYTGLTIFSNFPEQKDYFYFQHFNQHSHAYQYISTIFPINYSKHTFNYKYHYCQNIYKHCVNLLEPLKLMLHPFFRLLTYLAPLSLLNTTCIVLNNIFISRFKLQFSMYSTSMLTTSSKSVISLRPLTCHTPVSPGVIPSLFL